MQKLPSGTVTFLFTDIEGSTKLWQEHPKHIRYALIRHDALAAEAISHQGGILVKGRGEGDSLFAVFPRATDAVTAAITFQRALLTESWPLESPLRVRIALHTGETDLRDGDYYGSAVNRCARLRSIAHGGQVLLSRTAFDLVRDDLPTPIGLRDLGEHRLSELYRTEQVFQLLHPELRAEFPPLSSLDNLPNNLPQQPTSFIGREKEIDEIKALVQKSRLLTLTGPGGSGKTRLSLQVAADLLNSERDGVWLVELAALLDPSLVPQAVAQVLNIPEAVGMFGTKAVVEWLKPKRLLLVLDNCEHLVAACASFAAEVLRSCPSIHVLASSRQPLGVAGEYAYRVPSLSMPDPKKTETTEALSQYEAVRLFIERAQTVLPSFTITNANAPALVQVCWRLDGIPLALELAAARVRSLSVEVINTRLDDRFGLLTSGARNTFPRQQTLRALIDWSYNLLGDKEKSLLNRLSVFVGGGTLSALEFSCSGQGIEYGEVLDLLTSLVDKSLVVYDGGTPGGERYYLLETIRQYAGDRLTESVDAEAAYMRHASWCLALAEEAEPQLVGPDAAMWLERLETEHDNLRAALSRYGQQAMGSAAGLRLAGALWRFWAIRGYSAEALRWLYSALERTKEYETIGDEEALGAWAKALKGAGRLESRQGNHVVAETLYEQSLAIRRRLGDQEGIAHLLSDLGMSVSAQGDFVRARALLEESLAIRRQLEDEGGVARCLNSLGNVSFNHGDYARARILYEESLAIKKSLNDQGGIASTLGNLARIASAQGDFVGTMALLEQELTIRQMLRDQAGIIYTLQMMANTAAQRGDLIAARSLLEESLKTGRELGDKTAIAHSLEGMVGMALEQSHLMRAAKLMGAAAFLREAIRIPASHTQQSVIVQQVAAARAALGDDSFLTAWTEGRAMALEQAVEYALSDEE